MAASTGRYPKSLKIALKMRECTGIRRVLNDPALLETLLITIVILILSAGLSWILSWLWVMRFALIANRQPSHGLLLVCGHRLRDGQPSADYRIRLARAADAMARGCDVRLLLLGGGDPSEAGVGREWLITRHGVDPELIETEEDSIDSFENLRHARQMIPSDETVWLLSSRYHLGRLALFARQLGMKVELVPAEGRSGPSVLSLWRTIQEAVWVCWFASGRLGARLARRHHLLERIR